MSDDRGPPSRGHKITAAQIADYPDRIDVRSPSEFADDHLPGARNHPVLDDAERARIGTMHAQVSAFAARQAGAALVARNVATMLEVDFASKPKDWAPLVYCWRGGKRSGALAHILNEVGWRAVQLDGGYRSYRRRVLAQLAVLPTAFDYHVVCGLTGSGKSRLLAALAAEGAQVLDLEALARHRGSLLGDLPGDPQPSQKWFESQLVAELERFDPARPVYVESESRRIGTVQLPDALLAAMRAASCVVLDTPDPLRVELLKEEYAHFLADPALLTARLSRLLQLLGRKTLDRWAAAAAGGDWDTLVGELLVQHYDPMYTLSIAKNFPNVVTAITAAPTGVDATAFRALARDIDAAVRARHAARTPMGSDPISVT
jgi:tRNA 2-selenouridine synthase